jgi:hypothetical protein
MDSAVRSSVWLPGKANFPNGTKLLDERRHRVRRALSVRYETKHGVLGRLALAGWILRVRHHETSGAAEGRLVVAGEALIAVKADA